MIADVTDDKIDYSAYSDVLTKYVQGALSGEALAFTEETATVGVGAKTQLSLNTTAKLSVEYTSDDEEVATVSANGEVTGVSAGEATITAKIGTLFSATTTVTVEDNRTRDDLLAEQYTTEAIAGYPYTYAKGSVSVQKVSDNAVTMPTGFEGETYLQYNVDNDTAGKNLYGYAISMNKGITSVADKPASALLQNEFNVTDWSNAYVGFWVYQQSDMDFRVYHFGKVLTNDAEVYNFGNNALSESIAKNTWTYVEWKLTDFNASYTSNPFAMDSYFLRVGFGYKSSASVAIGALDQTFYIAGFDIYSKKAESEITRDDLLAETYVPDARAELEYMHAVGQVSVKNTSGSALTMPANFAGTSYLQYDITNESTLSSGNYHGYAIAMDSSKYPINENLLAKFSVTDWSNAYVGFWVYNDSNYTLNMYAQHETNFSAADTETVTTEKGAWTYVEWALTYFDASYTTNPFELAKYFLRIGFGFRVTGITTVGGLDATFYIAGFDIYTGSKAA